MRKKGVFLEYSIEIALIGREGGNILSVKQNLAFVRGLKSADNAQGCCLAAAGRTDENDELTVRDVQAEFLNGDDAFVRDLKIGLRLVRGVLLLLLFLLLLLR